MRASESPRRRPRRRPTEGACTGLAGAASQQGATPRTGATGTPWGRPTCHPGGDARAELVQTRRRDRRPISEILWVVYSSLRNHRSTGESYSCTHQR